MVTLEAFFSLISLIKRLFYLISLYILTYSGFPFLYYIIFLRCTCLEIWPFILGYNLCWMMNLTINFIDHLYFLGKVLLALLLHIDLNLLFYLIHLWICQFYLSLGTISFEAIVLSIFLIWYIVHVVLSSDSQLCKKTEAPVLFIFLFSWSIFKVLWNKSKSNSLKFLFTTVIEIGSGVVTLTWKKLNIYYLYREGKVMS